MTRIDKQDTKVRSPFARIREFADLASPFFKWATWLPGGICLLFYSMEIGHFPEGMELGEGLAFYLVCASVWIVCLLYALIAAMMGSMLVAPFAVAWQRLRKRRAAMPQKSKQKRPLLSLHADLRPMYDSALWIPATVGYLALAYYAKNHLQNAIEFLVMITFEGILIALWIEISRTLETKEIGLLLEHSAPDEQKEAIYRLSTVRTGLPIALLLVPALAGPQEFSLIDAAFQMAQLRKMDATVHVKQPWVDRVARSTLKPGPSFLGDDYREFKHTNVLLRSVGNIVVLELPTNKADRTTKLPIPAESIYIE